MKFILFLTLIIVSFNAFSKDVIGKVHTSGLIFKDSINIISFNDPDIKGITCYVTVTDKSFSFDNPSDSSIACRQTGEFKVTSFHQRQNDIFSANQSLFFKVMRVDRFYDHKNKSLIYISYTRKASGNNHAHSISVVPLLDLNVLKCYNDSFVTKEKCSN